MMVAEQATALMRAYEIFIGPKDLPKLPLQEGPDPAFLAKVIVSLHRSTRTVGPPKTAWGLAHAVRPDPSSLYHHSEIYRALYSIRRMLSMSAEELSFPEIQVIALVYRGINTEVAEYLGEDPDRITREDGPEDNVKVVPMAMPVAEAVLRVLKGFRNGYEEQPSNGK